MFSKKEKENLWFYTTSFKLLSIFPTSIQSLTKTRIHLHVEKGTETLQGELQQEQACFTITKTTDAQSEQISNSPLLSMADTSSLEMTLRAFVVCVIQLR